MPIQVNPGSAHSYLSAAGKLRIQWHINTQLLVGLPKEARSMGRDFCFCWFVGQSTAQVMSKGLGQFEAHLVEEPQRLLSC